MKGNTPQDELYKKEIGENLRRLRLERGLTQEELAAEMSERFGKTYTANGISLFEKGRDHMHIGAIFDFATFFGVPLSELAPSRFFTEADGVAADYRKLPRSGKAALKTFLGFLLEHPEALPMEPPEANS